MAEQRIVIKVYLRVQGEDPAVGCGDEWIDLAQRRVSFCRCTIKSGHQLYCRIHLLRFESKGKRQLASLERLKSNGRIDRLLKNGIRIPGRNLFDLHASCPRGHEDQLGGRAIKHYAQVKFALDGQSLFYQETFYLLPLRPRLVCYQLHAEDLGSELFGLFGSLGQFHAPTLAASASVDLCFHDDALRSIRE